jgi:hypothetical protein
MRTGPTGSTCLNRLAAWIERIAAHRAMRHAGVGAIARLWQRPPLRGLAFDQHCPSADAYYPETHDPKQFGGLDLCSDEFNARLNNPRKYLALVRD